VGQASCDLICIDAPRAEAIRGRLLGEGVAVKEGRESWRGESCCTAPMVAGADRCDAECCDQAEA
jgi:hypothetical protein